MIFFEVYKISNTGYWKLLFFVSRLKISLTSNKQTNKRKKNFPKIRHFFTEMFSCYPWPEKKQEKKTPMYLFNYIRAHWFSSFPPLLTYLLWSTLYGASSISISFCFYKWELIQDLINFLNRSFDLQLSGMSLIYQRGSSM